MENVLYKISHIPNTITSSIVTSCCTAYTFPTYSLPSPAQLTLKKNSKFKTFFFFNLNIKF